ncbi:helix-turn-helix domain-containing protein [Microbacterium luteum]|uniref:helix-turn-helix domain-containing protein n=1 Tax=Microbacterium luteum TaxID=2782167 RepID=UPI0018899A74|nr:helix-turn-helix domain-containing protein [Microbacterium luteum]
MTDAREGFARIPDWLYREAVPALGLTPREVAVYVVLVGRSDADGVCWPSQDLIAHEAGMSSRRAVRDALNALAEARLVAVTKGVGRQGTRYRLMPKPTLPDLEPFVVESRRNGVNSSPFETAEREQEWGQNDPVDAPEWVQIDPTNGYESSPEVDTGSRPNEVDTSTPTALRAAPPQRGDGADDVNADGQARLSALLPAFSVPDEQRQTPTPSRAPRVSGAHQHSFDPRSGYCSGCSARDDREESA